MLLSSRIRSYRMRLKITQKELARRVGVTPSTVCQWELGEILPTKASMVDLASCLGVTLEELKGEADERPFARQKKFIIDSYTAKPLKVKAIKYRGRSMDEELLKRFPSQIGTQYRDGQEVIVNKNTQKVPYRDEWLVFSPDGHKLLGIMTDSVFKATYERTL